jgi:hypothetical protein
MLTACAHAVKARPMSALGHKRTFEAHQPMSALPPKAIHQRDDRCRAQCPDLPKML